MNRLLHAAARTEGKSMKTTLNKIREHSPCANGWAKLLKNLGKTRAVDGHQREMRLYAVDCARSVQHLMTDPLSIAAIDVAERHANGDATDDELAAAWAAAGAAAGAAAIEVQSDLLRIMCAEIEQREGV